MPIKLQRFGSGWPVLVGCEMPKHIQIAHGRGIFRLMHGGDSSRGVWLRDLPLSLHDLAHMGFEHGYQAYVRECERTNQPVAF